MVKNKWIHKYFSSGDFKKISQAVELAESKTTGEIVPMVVRSSSVIHHIPFEIFLLKLILILGFYLVFQPFFIQHGLTYLLPVSIALSFPVSFLTAKINFVKRWFIPKADRHFQVFNRAQIEFYQNFSHKTKNDTAVLIFISLLEKQCIVLADSTIASKIKQQAWDDVVALIIRGFREDRTAEGLIQAIQKTGEHLNQYFPATKHTKNELPNDLVVKE